MSKIANELAARLIETASAAGIGLITAESCTAGALARILALQTGAGQCFHGGYVTYTKLNKMHALGVRDTTLAAHTAVSAQVADAMARGALQRSPAHLSLAITGVAGPDRDEDGNPVGLVVVAVRHRDGHGFVEQHRFGGDPTTVCDQAIATVLQLALTIALERRSASG